jgi:hypothetical protein
MPQRTERRASRFFWLRLLFASESESLTFPPCSKSYGVGELGNLGPRGRKGTLRLAAATLVKETRCEVALVDKVKDSERR